MVRDELETVTVNMPGNYGSTVRRGASRSSENCADRGNPEMFGVTPCGMW